MKRTALAAAIALSVPAISLSAAADKPAAKTSANKADASDRRDPENITAISVYMETLLEGIQKYQSKEPAGAASAIDLFKKAIALAPKQPLGHYLLGEGYLATNNLPEAEAAFKRAVEVSDSKNPGLRSHILFAMADCYEREKKWAEAKTAWQAYTEHAAKVPDAGAFPATGAARLQTMEKALEREKIYAAVRERIAAEKDGGAAPAAAPSAAPPASPKK